MIDAVRKAVFIGVGAMSAGAEAVQKKMDSLVKQGKITKDEAEQLMKELLEKTNKERIKISEKIEKETIEFLQTAGAITRKTAGEAQKALHEMSERFEKRGKKAMQKFVKDKPKKKRKRKA